jgi:hypothetical protein
LLKHRNKFEDAISGELAASGVTFQYEGYQVPYILAGHYTPDFTVSTSNGKIIIETKGLFRPEDKRKLIAVKKCNPKLDIRLLFYANVKSNTKWCKKHGFKYAIKHVPKEWLHGF